MKILITAGGTATAWYLSKIKEKFYKKKFFLIVTDIKPKYLIPSSIYADKFYQVPENEDERIQKYYEILEKNKVNIIIPLADNDVRRLTSDNLNLIALNVRSLAPNSLTIEKVGDKLKLYNFCKENNIPTPNLYSLNQINPNKDYIIKPINLFGSKGITKIKGEELLSLIKINKDLNNIIIQEWIEGPEITVELFFISNNKFSFVMRERLETKEGVCVKARFVPILEVEEIIKKLIDLLQLPIITCLQFIKDEKGWLLTDLNLRMGAGSALSARAGWNAAKALYSFLLGENDPFKYLKKPKPNTVVLRVYEEILMK